LIVLAEADDCAVGDEFAAGRYDKYGGMAFDYPEVGL
jgi:hypothetical protein